MKKMTRKAFIEDYVEAVYGDRDMLCVIWDDDDQQMEITVGWDHSPKACADCIKECVDDDYDYEEMCDYMRDGIEESADSYYDAYLDKIAWEYDV